MFKVILGYTVNWKPGLHGTQSKLHVICFLPRVCVLWISPVVFHYPCPLTSVLAWLNLSVFLHFLPSGSLTHPPYASAITRVFQLSNWTKPSRWTSWNCTSNNHFLPHCYSLVLIPTHLSYLELTLTKAWKSPLYQGLSSLFLVIWNSVTSRRRSRFCLTKGPERVWSQG